jgi:hypothetical protein
MLGRMMAAGQWVGLSVAQERPGQLIGVDKAAPNVFCLVFRVLRVSRLCTRLSLER